MARSVPDARRDLARLRDPLRRVLLQELVPERPKRLDELVPVDLGEGPGPKHGDLSETTRKEGWFRTITVGRLKKTKGVTGHFPWVA